jgi:branched-chain amino acid transport system ATP-binding protein
MAIVLDHVSAGYGGRPVLFDVSCHVDTNECLGIFGHNGAGKSTLLRILGGVLPLTGGSVTRPGEAQTGGRFGSSIVPQEDLVFDHLDVQENLMLGLWDQPVSWRRAADRLEPVYEFLPVLSTLARRRAGTLSGGERRLVALGRALASDPDTLLLDEPSLGLSPAALEVIMDKVAELRGRKTIVLVEQNLAAALAIVGRYYVMRQGEIVDEASRDGQAPVSLEQLSRLV